MKQVEQVEQGWPVDARAAALVLDLNVKPELDFNKHIADNFIR